MESHTIIATFGKQFAVDWGDGSQIETFTGIEPLQALKHTYSLNPGRYKVTISGAEDCFFTAFWAGRSDTLDLSSCSSIKKVTKGGTVAGSLRSINARNCVNLEELELGRVSDDGNLSVLDLRDNVALRDLSCPGNQITHIDLVSTNMKYIWCFCNRLKLSYLYAFSEMISDPWAKIFGYQELHKQRIALGDSIDFSDQKEFGGIKTVFQIDKGEGVPASPLDYCIHEGVITFYNSGYFRIIMTNDAIIAYQDNTVVVQPVYVIDFVPVQEIIDLPAEAAVGVPLQLYRYGTVVPSNATYQGIVWSVKDAGTTGATIPYSTLYTAAPGRAFITATITDGTAIGTPYTQDFCIEVEPLGVNEPLWNNITLIPNPTTGELQVTSYELRITSVEVYDIYGKKQLSNHLITPSSHHKIDISYLSAGIYFVKITTEQGEVVKKVIKQ